MFALYDPLSYCPLLPNICQNRDEEMNICQDTSNINESISELWENKYYIWMLVWMIIILLPCLIFVIVVLFTYQLAK